MSQIEQHCTLERKEVA